MYTSFLKIAASKEVTPSEHSNTNADEVRSQDIKSKKLCYSLLCSRYSRSKKKKHPQFISIQIIVQKWKWYHWILGRWSGIIMDSCLLQFDALKFFLGARLHGGYLPNFNFFYVNPQIFRRNRKVRL